MPLSRIVRQALKGSSKIVVLGAKLLFMENKILQIAASGTPLALFNFFGAANGEGRGGRGTT